METEYSKEFLKGLSRTGAVSSNWLYATIGGNLFISGTGKILFQKKGPLLVSINHSLQYTITSRVYEKLQEKGYTRDQIMRDREYQNAWKDFIAWALETKFIQIKEVELK